MGIVYEARDPALSRTVALKTILPSPSARRETFEERFFSEARIAARLSHPGIVVVHDVGRDPESGVLYIALEHLAGAHARRGGRGRAARLARGLSGWAPRWRAPSLTPIARGCAPGHEAGQRDAAALGRDEDPGLRDRPDRDGAFPADEPRRVHGHAALRGARAGHHRRDGRAHRRLLPGLDRLHAPDRPARVRGREDPGHRPPRGALRPAAALAGGGRDPGLRGPGGRARHGQGLGHRYPDAQTLAVDLEAVLAGRAPAQASEEARIAAAETWTPPKPRRAGADWSWWSLPRTRSSRPSPRSWTETASQVATPPPASDTNPPAGVATVVSESEAATPSPASCGESACLRPSPSRRARRRRPAPRRLRGRLRGVETSGLAPRDRARPARPAAGRHGHSRPRRLRGEHLPPGQRRVPPRNRPRSSAPALAPRRPRAGAPPHRFRPSAEGGPPPRVGRWGASSSSRS